MKHLVGVSVLHQVKNYIYLTILVLLTACGGGGAGSSAQNDSETTKRTTVPVATLLYSVGGSVAGLTSDGLELANGTQTLVVRSGSSTFQFNDLIEAGQSYAVVIKTQPAGLVCSVSNGSGNIVAGNVTNIVVTCSLSAHQLGGTIVGLTESGLLVANGTENLSLAPESSVYVFQQPVAEGGDYAVKIIRQPQKLSCKLDSSTSKGTMGAVPISSLKIICMPAVFHKITGSFNGLLPGSELEISSDGAISLRDSVAILKIGDTNGFNGTFDFGNVFAENEPYHLMAVDKKTGKVCNVVNGNGVMGTEDINNVAVYCSEQGYSVGGTVTGITDSGLVLVDNNNRPVLNLSMDATQFVTPKMFAGDGQYYLRIITQPLGQFCTIGKSLSNPKDRGTEIYGALEGNDINDLTINCKPVHKVSGTIQGLTDIGLVFSTKGFSTVYQTHADRGQSLINFGSVSKGEAYSISVAGNPQDIRCVITQGQQGVMADGDITNVVIQCQGVIPQSPHITDISRDIRLGSSYIISHEYYDTYEWIETKVLLDDGTMNIYREQFDFIPDTGYCPSSMGLCGSFSHHYVDFVPFARQVKAMSGYGATGAAWLGKNGSIYNVGDTSSSPLGSLQTISKMAYRGWSTLAVDSTGTLIGYYSGCNGTVTTDCLHNIADVYIAGTLSNHTASEIVTYFAITDQGQVYGWGLGDGVMGEKQMNMPEPSRDTPHLISTLTNIKQISSSQSRRSGNDGMYTNIFALRHDGQVYRWSADFGFQLPSYRNWQSQATDAELKPTLISGLNNVKEISDRLALLNDGTVIVDLTDITKKVTGLPPIKHLSSDYLIDFTGRVYRTQLDTVTETYYVVEVTHP